MIRFIPMILWIYLASCSGKSFEGHTGANPKQGSNNQNPGAPEGPDHSGGPKAPVVNNPKSNPATDPSVYSMPPGTAVIPVAIGGASLTCQADDAYGMLCGASKPSFAPVKAYYASEMEKTWIPTTFEKKADAIYAVTLPEDLKGSPLNVAVMLVNADNKYMADMEMVKSSEIVNLAVDGSFETRRIGFESLPRGSFIAPGDQMNWFGSRPYSEMDSCRAFLNIGSEFGDSNLHAAQGSQWAELASPCELDDEDDLQQNLAITQTLKLIPGHSYRISYAFRTVPGDDAAHHLAVNFENMPIHNTSVYKAEWTYASFIQVANQENVELMFVEEKENGGRGTLIDNIVVVDLTAMTEAR